MNNLSPVEGGAIIVIIMFAVLFMLSFDFKKKK